MRNKQKNQPPMIQSCSTCHLPTKSPAPSMGKGMHRHEERRTCQALHWAHMICLTLPAFLWEKCSYCLVTDEKKGSGRSRPTGETVESWDGARGLSVPSECFSYKTALSGSMWLRLLSSLGPSQSLETGCKPLTSWSGENSGYGNNCYDLCRGFISLLVPSFWKMII